ncbi:MAG: AMP-binding protein [Chloroflexota bacterium]
MSDLPELLWSPAPDARQRTAMGRFLAAVERDLGRTFTGYDDAWRWSVEDPGAFWVAVWTFFEATTGLPPAPALASASMPGATWFPGAALNWAERVLAMPGRSGSDEVVVGVSQTRDRVALTADELRDAVARCRAGLIRLGVRRGDRVAAYLPNIPETVIAVLATASLGATWTSCAPEFGTRAVVDRLAQVEPVVLLAVDGYRYGDRPIDRAAEVAAIRAALPSLRATVVVPYLRPAENDALAAVPGAVAWSALLADTVDPAHERQEGHGQNLLAGTRVTCKFGVDPGGLACPP